MLASLGTQLARARRQRVLLPIFPVSTADIALTCLETASRLEKDILLQIVIDELPAITVETLRNEIIPYARRLPIHVSLLTAMESTHDLPDVAYLYEADDLTAVPASSLEMVPFFHFHPQGEELRTYLNQAGAVAFGFNFEQTDMEASAAVLKYIENTTTTCKLPAVVRGLHPHASMKKKLVHAGVTGVILSGELNKAFTGGLRTALRNWAAENPSIYLGKALRAVDDYVANQLRSPLEP
jgi:hypothetical protein